MESNSVNITQADNTIVVIEPTGNTITIVEQNDSSEVTSQTQQFEGTVITQTSITLEIEDSPNTVNVIPERGVTEITVNQPVTETVKIATIGPQGPVGPIGPVGPSGSLILSGSIDNDVIITGSVKILGSLTITGSVNGEFTGSLLGTASNAISASYALSASLSQTASYVETAQTASYVETAQTASYVLNAISASFAQTASYVETAQTASYVLNAISASFAQTASYVNPLTQDVQITGSLDVSSSITAISFTGSFSGSFEGDGSGLTQIPASGIVGLNLSQIATTNVTASVNEGTDSFKIVSGSTIPFAIKSGSGNISASGDLSIKGFPSVSESLSSAGKITYDTASGDTFDLTNIQVNDYDDNVAINFINGKLTFTFGTPEVPSSINSSLSGFATDRFNKVTDNYTINGNWNNGGYTLISASLYEGSTLLEEVGTGTSLSFNTTTSGSHIYRLEYTASSPLDSSLYKTTDTVTGTLSKSDPTSPSISRTYNVQLRSGNNIEEGATGSIAFTTSSGALNGWEYTGGSTSPSSSPVTVSATGNVTIQATANYQSPSGDNNPQLTRTKTSTATSSRIRSLRYGTSTSTSFSESEIQDIDEWVNNIGTIVVGTTNPNNQQFTVTTSAEYIYIIYDSGQSDLSAILNVNNSNSNDINVFTKTVVGNYNVYRSNNLSTTSILYKLTT